MSETMKLNDNTLSVLSNFANIQSNLLVTPGSKITTFAEAKNIMAEAELDQEFPAEMAIYELNEFLQVLGLFESPVLTFEADHVVVSNEERSTKIVYHYAAKEMLTFLTKSIEPPPTDVKTEVSLSTLGKIQKSAGIFGHPLLSFQNNKLLVCSSTMAKGELSSDNFYQTYIDTDIVGEIGDDFRVNISIPLLKFVPDSYNVNISSKKLAVFTAQNRNIKYFVSVDATSHFS